jgi:hypothetical protein
VIKLLWLAICTIEDKRARDRAKEAGLGRGAKRKADGRLVEGQVTTNWKQALAQLALVYPDRINPHTYNQDHMPYTEDLTSSRGTAQLWSGPAARVVAGLVADQGVGDLVGAVRHRAADHAALLPAGPQRLSIASGCRIGMPPPDPEVDQRPPQSHAAFPADAAVTTLPARLVLGRGQAGGAIQLPGSRPPLRVADRGAAPGSCPSQAR